jgi:hypothetical protein
MCIDGRLRSLLRLPASIAHAVREQADREEFDRIDASLAGDLPDITHALMSRRSGRRVVQADPDDPLELLWRLEAARPR